MVIDDLYDGEKELVLKFLKENVDKLNSNDFDGLYNSALKYNAGYTGNEALIYYVFNIMGTSGVDYLSHMTSIKPFIFTKSDYIESKEIPGNIIKIYDNAFSDSTIQRVIINDGVSEIGKFAFADCHALQEVELPNSLEVIDDFAFKSDRSLEKIKLPDDLVYLGKNIFIDCSPKLEVECNQDMSLLLRDSGYKGSITIL